MDSESGFPSGRSRHSLGTGVPGSWLVFLVLPYLVSYEPDKSTGGEGGSLVRSWYSYCRDCLRLGISCLYGFGKCVYRDIVGVRGFQVFHGSGLSVAAFWRNFFDSWSVILGPTVGWDLSELLCVLSFRVKPCSCVSWSWKFDGLGDSGRPGTTQDANTFWVL